MSTCIYIEHQKTEDLELKRGFFCLPLLLLYSMYYQFAAFKVKLKVEYKLLYMIMYYG